MPYLELIDETLDINSTENYELSLEVSKHGLSFCILDTLRNKFVLLRAFEPEDSSTYEVAEIEDIICKDDFLGRKFKFIKIITPSSKSTLVPSPLYDESMKDEYFKFNLIPAPEDIILTNKLPEPDASLIFSIPESICGLLNARFPGVRINHHLLPLFRHIVSNSKNIPGNYIHVHLQKDFFNLVIYDQNTLRFCNTFQYNTYADIRYYLLYVLRRMNLRQEETINFSGITRNSEEMVSDFSSYIRDIRFAEPSGNFTFSYIFNETELHKFLNLFSITNCE